MSASGAIIDGPAGRRSPGHVCFARKATAASSPDQRSDIRDFVKIPGRHADYKREVIDKQVALMQKRGIWKKPAHSPG